MLKDQTVIVHWNGNNRKHYESKGYIFTKNNDAFEISVQELPDGSHIKVAVVCDYCGREVLQTYKDYVSRHIDGKDCCTNCKRQKAWNTNIIKYGGKSPTCDSTVREKQKESLFAKYGVCVPAKNDEIKPRMFKTSFEKYGVNVPAKAQTVKDKAVQTCIEKYGGRSSQCDINVREKTMKSRMQNGNIPTSKQETEMTALLQEMYGTDACYPQYVLDRISFDCLLIIDDVKIDVEYDGNYWHRDKEKDIKRDYYTIGQGYKVLRFKSDYNVPTKEQIIQGVDYLVNSQHHHLIVNI